MAKGSVKQRIVVEGDRVYNVWDQPNRGQILEENAEKRKTNPRKSQWMKPLASIPEMDREELKQKNPDLFRDRRKLEKFVNTSDGSKYRTTPKGRSRNFSFGGL